MKLLFVFITFYICHLPIYAQINVLTTTSDLASITKEIGQDLISVESLAQGSDDLHYLSAQPNFILKANKADLLILIGMDLEIGWLPLILKQARNSKIQKGNIGYCDTSVDMPVLEKPTTEVNRSMGDIHIYGNPHYWTDPARGVLIAKKITDALIKNDNNNAEKYNANFIIFKNKTKTLLTILKNKMLPYKETKFISYHNEFIYLAERFNLIYSNSLEEKPGVPPSLNHINKIIDLVKKENIKIIFMTPWQSSKYPLQISKKTGIPVAVLPIQTANNQTWFAMLENNIDIIIKSLK